MHVDIQNQTFPRYKIVSILAVYAIGGGLIVRYMDLTSNMIIELHPPRQCQLNRYISFIKVGFIAGLLCGAALNVVGNQL